MSAKLNAAIDYAEMGFRVFPCLPDSKEPATAHGCLDATSDVEQIERWWARNPDYNVAIATDGWLIVDVDPDGKAWLPTVNTDDLMRGSMASTPRGGSHYWFRQNGTQLHNTAGKLARGVDTRADGGYVLVPPSTVGGRAYVWVSELTPDQPVVPDWLVEQLGVHRPVRESVGEQVVEGSRNHAMFKFAGYFRRAGLTAAEMLPSLESLNQLRCRPPLTLRELQKIADSVSRYEPDAVEESLILSHLHAQTDEDVETWLPEPVAAFPQWCIDRLPVVMREAYDYGGIIAVFGAALGHRVCDDYDTRTNVMVLAVAPSGAGKEHPRQRNKAMLESAGMTLVNGPERIGSHAGIVSAVSQHSIRLFQLDEIGRLLMTMRDPKVSHLYNVGTVLMALYSSSNVTWTGDAYADTTRVKTIQQPHVCVYGSSVPESLYGGLSPDNLTDGLVGRLIVFEAVGIPDRRKPNKMKIPHVVTSWLEHWYGSGCRCEDLDKADLNRPRGNLEDAKRKDPGPPLLVKKDEDADRRHEEYCDAINEKHRSEDRIASAVWSRAPEKAAKLALIHACSHGCGTPRITLESENWGIALANYSTRLVLQAARNVVAGSKYESSLKRVFMAIGDGCTRRELTRRTQWLRSRERTEILADLQSSGAIKVEDEPTNGRPRMMIRRTRCVL